MRAARAALLGGALLLAAGGGALAQVSVNSGALDRLRPESTPSRHAQPRESRHASPVRHAVPHPREPASPVPSAATAAKPGQVAAPTAVSPAMPPQIPAAPPAPVALPPPAITVPTAPPPPLPPIPIADDAPGAAEPIPGGVRVNFGKDRTDLNPATAAAIQQVAGQAKNKPGALDVTAYAAGSPDDPSTPRRLSLSRALAVRTVLLHAGIESPRIYVHALGAAPAGTASGPADRVDVTRQAASSSAQASGK